MPQQVEFNAVTVNNGAKIAVNFDKTLSAVGNGSYLVSNNTNGQLYTYSETFAVINSYVSQLYGDDPLFSNKVAFSDQDLFLSSLRGSDVQYIDKVDLPYWLSDGVDTGIRYKAYANADNTLANNILKVTGKVNGKEYLESTIAKGPYAFRDDITPENYASSSGAYWNSTSTSELDFAMYLTANKYMHNGDKVYNHPDCRDSGQDAFGFEYKSSTIQRADISGDMVMGYVSNGNIIKKVELNKTYPSGTVFVFSFYKTLEEISDPTGFMGYDRNSSYYVLGFIKISEPANILLNMLAKRTIFGVSKYYNEGETITGVPITAEAKAIRKIFNNRSSNIAFFRDSSSSSVTKSSTFGNVPLSSTFNGDVVKAVAKSSSTTISDGIANDKLSTDLDSVKESVYFDNAIKVPYNSKTLTIDKSAFTTANANYISALADSSAMKKYTVLGSTEEDITIDLASIVNTHQPGDYATVSFYAEKNQWCRLY